MPAVKFAAMIEGMSSAEREAFILRGKKFRPHIQAQLDTLSNRINAREGMRKAAATSPGRAPSQREFLLSIEGGPLLPRDFLPAKVA